MATASVSELSEAEKLDQMCDQILPVYDEVEADCSDLQDTLFNYVLNNITRDKTGRIISPLLWNPEVEDKLSNNYELATKILKSNLRKLQSKSPEVLRQYNEVICKQVRENIIERVDLESYLSESDGVSFLPHSAVIRENAETTKCRVVFLANLADRRSGGLSHNQVSFSGRNLNNSLLDSLLFLRFEKFLYIFDLVSAFLQIRIRESDTKKLLFLWYEDVENGNFNVVGYRFLRLGFGLRFSPNILLCALHFMLSKDASEDSMEIRELKKKLLFLTYMDNISYTSSSPSEVKSAYYESISIFKKYCFDLQKFATNCQDLQSEIDANHGTKTAENIKLFGLMYNRINDDLRTNVIKLNPLARTKRSIVSTVQEQFDLLGINLPFILPAKLFMHGLQSTMQLGWDQDIGDQLSSEWVKICSKVNCHVPVPIDRNMGERDSDYALVVCSDSSKLAMGLVVYLWDLKTDHVSFIYSKTRMIGKKLNLKSMPVKELCALSWGVETVVSVFKTLTNSMLPLKISKVIALADSTIALSWVKARAIHFDKIEKKAVLINNRVNGIVSTCQSVPVTFGHISGETNPADVVSRAKSHGKIASSCFYSGPNLKILKEETDSFVVSTRSGDAFVGATTLSFDEPLLELDKHSSFKRSARVMEYVFSFVQIYKDKLAAKFPNRFSHLRAKSSMYVMASRYLIRKSQEKAYPDVFKFFHGNLQKSPSIVLQLNLTLDNYGILRVKSKFGRLDTGTWANKPVLLPKSCHLTRALIRDFHAILRHGQALKILNALRSHFYVPSAYSLVKGIIKRCVFCRQLHGRTIPVNVNDYRSFRSGPGKRPFSTIMMDFTGAYSIKDENSDVKKYYVLLITCMFTRNVRLYVCPSLDTASFLHAMQMHIFEFGVPELIISDNQPSFNTGYKVIKSCLSAPEIIEFLKDKNIKELSYDPYPANSPNLGGAVESLVGQIKNILYASVGKSLLDLSKFQLLVAEAQILVNKRPIGQKEVLTSNETANLDQCVITPEMLVKGYEVPSMNVLPSLSDEETIDISWTPGNPDDITTYFNSFSKNRNKLYELYEGEFLRNLERQATNKPSRYKRSNQPEIHEGDLVAIKTPLLKPFSYPRALITSIERNNLGEINALSLRKANKEVIRRHPSDVILLQSFSDATDSKGPAIGGTSLESDPPSGGDSSRPKREAKRRCLRRNKELAESGLV